MTDRFNALTVVLESDIREDDAQALMSAIRLLHGVIEVKGNVSDPLQLVCDARARRELGEKFFAILYPKD